MMTALGFEVVIGGLTFTGSLMAAAKLQELLPGAPSPTRARTSRTFACWRSSSGRFVYLIVTIRP